MIPLVIDEKVRADIQRVKEYASKNVVSLETLKGLMAGQGLPLPGDKEEFSLCVPMGFKVVYSHEEQPHGVCRHLSISINVEGRVPHPQAVIMMCQEFGFINVFADCMVWTEKIGDALEAINVVEPLDGNFEPFRKEK